MISCLGASLVKVLQISSRRSSSRWGPVADLTHLTLAAVPDLAAHVGLGTLDLELGQVGLEFLTTSGQIQVALVLDTLLLDLHLGLEGGESL